MDVKYVVIDLSKIDTNKLEEMLTKAYTDGYQKGRECIGGINAPTIPYNGDAWNSITGYTTTANSMTIDTSKSPLTSSSGICVGSDLEAHTITLANHTKVVNSPD